MLTVIGLGNERGELTLSALKALKKANKVFVKDGGEALADFKEEKIKFEACGLFQEELLKEAQKKDICYCVGGSVFDDPVASALMREKGVSTIDCCSYKTIPDEELVKKERFTYQDFLYILKRLRAPDGCPWDRVQTHESIRINMIEEAYELVDAIDLDDPEKMCEETGDVLMQAVFHALIEEERGRFNAGDMVSGVCKKLVSRHTHVFGGDSAKGADGALSVWDKNKMTEKHQTTFSDAVNDVPQCFPALLRAQKIVKRMAKGGWNFQTPQNCKNKFDEETRELEEAIRSGDKASIQSEFGDLLMVFMHTAYMLGIDSEQALLDTVKKVAKRYTEWERLVLADGKDVHNLSDEEWVAYYKKAKENVCKN
ncbi:MAG: nucleoside triphosphate pyrophosphohydrolase [Clostridia bacterium]|nr:nucleoside triphosphate pyrophosphohydrolase [Clostridia bacterium]